MLKPSRSLVQYAFRLTIGLAVVALVLWIVLGDATFQKCIKNPNPESTKDPFENNIPLLHVRGCIGAFVHGNAESIIAIFTVILGFATLFLWWATRNLVVDAKKTAERQLRAYIWARPHTKRISNLSELSKDGVTFIVINNGQTPAYNVSHVIGIGVFDRPLKHGFPSEPGFGKRGSRFVLNPGMTSELGAALPIEISEEEKTSIIVDKSSAIYIWGEIRYDDAFERHQVTKFRMFSDGIGLHWCEEGNEAT